MNLSDIPVKAGSLTWTRWMVLFWLGTFVPVLLVAAVLLGSAPIVNWEQPQKYLSISRGLLEHGALVEELDDSDFPVAVPGSDASLKHVVPAVERLPAYPIFVAALWWLVGPESYLWIIAVQCLLGGIFAVAMAAAAIALHRDWFWPAGLLACAWPNVQWWATVVMPEMLLVTSVAVGLASVLWLPRARRPWQAAGIAALGFGIAFMTKPQVLLLPVVVGPTVWWYLVRAGFGRGRATALATVPVAAMLALAGVQIMRVHSAYGAFLFTTHGTEHALFYVWPCVTTSFGCGASNLAEEERARNAFLARVAELPDAQKTNPVILYRIKGDLFQEFVAASDKVAIARAVAGGYVRLMLNTVVGSGIERFGRTLPHLSTTPGQGLRRARNFAGRVVSEPAALLWAAAQMLLLATRILQGVGLIGGICNQRLRSSTVIIAVLTVAVLATAAGMVEARYRVEAEPMLLLLTVVGADLLSRRFAKKSPEVLGNSLAGISKRSLCRDGEIGARPSAMRQRE